MGPPVGFSNYAYEHLNLRDKREDISDENVSHEAASDSGTLQFVKGPYISPKSSIYERIPGAPVLLSSQNIPRVSVNSSSYVPISRSFKTQDFRNSVKEMLQNNVFYEDPLGNLKEVRSSKISNVQVETEIENVGINSAIFLEEVSSEINKSESSSLQPDSVKLDSELGSIAEDRFEILPSDAPYNFESARSVKDKELGNVSLGEKADFYSRISYLNEYVPYVKVSPPRLGSPLAPDTALLDLSCVERNTNASPFFHIGVEDLDKDELKLYSILEYELSKLDFSSETLESLDNGELEKGSHSGPQSFMGSLFHKIFRLGIYTKKLENEEKRSWSSIIKGIDDPPPVAKISTDEHNSSSVHMFERNNTDMFAVNIKHQAPIDLEENMLRIRRHKVDYITKTSA